jgi:hypothetical protein
MDSGLATLKQGSAFKDLAPAKDLPGTQISVRLPPAFGQPLSKGTTVEGAAVEDTRLKPVGLEWPALKETYEAFIPDASEGKMPYYLYVSVTDPGSTTLDKTSRTLYAMVGGKFDNGTGEWQDVRFNTPEGGSTAWKKLRATGDQEFLYVDKGGKASTRKMPGLLEVYLREQGGVILFLAWRMPQSIEPNVKLAELSKLVCGSLVIRE